MKKIDYFSFEGLIYVFTKKLLYKEKSSFTLEILKQIFIFYYFSIGGSYIFFLKISFSRFFYNYITILLLIILIKATKYLIFNFLWILLPNYFIRILLKNSDDFTNS